jgi:hypothetical protein
MAASGRAVEKSASAAAPAASGRAMEKASPKTVAAAVPTVLAADPLDTTLSPTTHLQVEALPVVEAASSSSPSTETAETVSRSFQAETSSAFSGSPRAPTNVHAHDRWYPDSVSDTSTRSNLESYRIIDPAASGVTSSSTVVAS